MTITFTILGLPAPQGSKTNMPNGAMVEGSSRTGRQNLRDWRTACIAAARDQAALTGRMSGALELSVQFRFPMPVRARKRDRPQRLKATKPDLDKLVRALGDALKLGGLIDDDARIARLVCEKIETVEWCGAVVTIRSAWISTYADLVAMEAAV